MQDTDDIDVHALLAQRKQIADIWCIEDVHGLRPDLTDDQAWDVLQQVKRKYDAEFGICWLTLEIIADLLYPERNPDPE